MQQRFGQTENCIWAFKLWIPQGWPKYSLAKVQYHSPQQSPATLCPLWENLENLETWEVAGLKHPFKGPLLSSQRINQIQAKIHLRQNALGSNHFSTPRSITVHLLVFSSSKRWLWTLAAWRIFSQGVQVHILSHSGTSKLIGLVSDDKYPPLKWHLPSHKTHSNS